MRLELPKNAVNSPLVVMRRAGYSAFTDPVTRKESFVLRLSNAFYPRLHAYVHDEGEKFVFDVHLDQKQPTYGDGNMHGGEYEGPTIAKEIARISSWANAVMREEHAKLSKEDAGDHSRNAPDDKKRWYSWFWN